MNRPGDSKIELARLISHVSLFSGLKPELVNRLVSCGNIRQLPKQTFLFQQTEPIAEAHFLISGLIKRSTLLHDHPKILDIVHPGQTIAMSEILCSASYRSSAKAIENSIVIGIPLVTLLDITRRDPALAFKLLQFVAESHHSREFELASHHALPASRRVLDYLLSLAGDQRDIAGETTVRLDANKRTIAARLDMTPETFSRTLNQMSKDGVIVVSGRNIHIQNAPLVIEERFTAQTSHRPRYMRKERGEVNRMSAASLINLCGRLRMLSQRLATAWILQQRGIRPRKAAIALRRHAAQFDEIVGQLGKLELSPSPCERLGAIESSWPTYRSHLGDEKSAQDAEAIFDLSEQVLDMADRLTAGVAQTYGTETDHQVNVAGRNRMLSVRITKLYLFSTWNVRSSIANSLISAARDEFAANLDKLRIHAAGSHEAIAQLDLDLQHWNEMLNTIDQFDHSSKAENDYLKLIDVSESLIRHADTTVKLFEVIAERNSGTAGRHDDYQESAISKIFD